MGIASMGCQGTKEKAGDVAEKKLTIHYFQGLRSRGEMCRMVAAHGDVQYESHELSFEEWGKFKEEQGKLEPKGIQTLPYITKSDGTNMAETCDIMKYLAELGGKFVIDDATYKLAERANAPPFCMVDPFLNLPEEARKNFGIDTPVEDMKKIIAENWKTLADELGDKNFFAGEKPGYGEVYVFHNIDNGLSWADKELSELCGEEVITKLKAFHKRMSELPGIKEYLATRPKFCGMPGSVGNPGEAAAAPAAGEAAAGNKEDASADGSKRECCS